MRIVFLALTVVLLGAATPIAAEESADSLSLPDRIDLFKLWNACGQIDLRVEQVRAEEIERGLTTEDIATTIRSRLRAARLYRNDGWVFPALYVNVSAVSGIRAFCVRLEFWKRVFDPISGQESLATTWSRGITGQGGASYILSQVSRLTDIFIDDYLRVNESGCSRSPIDP